MGRPRGAAATSVAERAGCVVSAWRAGRPEAGARSCSGVALRRRPGLVLCHGGVLAPFLLRAGGRALAAAEGSALPADCCGRDLRLRVRWGPAPAAPGARSRLPAAGPGPALRSARCAGPGLGPAPRRPRGRPAELLLLLSCPAFRAHFARLFGADDERDRDRDPDRAQAGRWRFAGGGEDEDEDGPGAEEEEEAAQLRALGWFALLRVRPGEEDSEDEDSGPDPHPGLAVAPLGALAKGAPLLACASPFGASCPDLFLNTLSRGVLSNAAGPLLLTDARCLPGSEGGGVFALGAPGPAGMAEMGAPGLDGALVALVAAPLCWRAGEWVGLSLLCAAAPLLAALRRALVRLRPRDGPALAALLPPEIAAADARTPATPPATPGPPWAAAAVLVECGAVWGSGVALAPRLVLTCRHVAPREGARVLVRAPHGDAPE